MSQINPEKLVCAFVTFMLEKLQFTTVRLLLKLSEKLSPDPKCCSEYGQGSERQSICLPYWPLFIASLLNPESNLKSFSFHTRS